MPNDTSPATTAPTELVRAAEPVTFAADADLLWNPAAFEHAQRVAKMFASSELVPPHLRGKVADVTIALLMAKRLHEDPLMVMQSIYVVSGRAGWGATYMIARAIRSGAFRGRLNWRIEGKGDALSVTCYATLADTGEVVEAAASMAMAAAEGWTKNPKYRSMPEQMLRYRSATMLVRLYAPDVMFGLPTADEAEDLAWSSPQPGSVEVVQPSGAAARVRQRLLVEDPVEPPVLPVAPPETVPVDAALQAQPPTEPAASSTPAVVDDEPDTDPTRRPRNYAPKLRGLGWRDVDIESMSAPLMRRILADGLKADAWTVTTDGSLFQRPASGK